jgi:hypothetical protein
MREESRELLVMPWTDEDIALLRTMRVAGASPGRVSVALKKSPQSVKSKARELGIPFEPIQVQRKLQKEKELAARAAAGLPPQRDGRGF